LWIGTIEFIAQPLTKDWAYHPAPSAVLLGRVGKSRKLEVNYDPLPVEAWLKSPFSHKLGWPQNGGRSKAFGLFPTA